ncbi:MAG: NfeD family protein [Actinobacteria bacterium]|nr:NfeD family protein [Actinomycetota bacterium]
MAWMWWLGAALILGVVEMLTVDLVFVMFVGGALAAMVVALLGLPAWVQVMTFALVSWALLQVARPAAKAWIESSTPDTKTNVDALIGRNARVVHEVTEETGRVKFSGEVWTARSARRGEVFAVGEDVVVTAINGAIAMVARPEPPSGTH